MSGSAITNEALLALIVPDPDAMVVLAAWGALGPPLAAVLAEATHRELGELTGLGSVRAAAAVRKLNAARALVDGGITDLADRLLQQHVKQQLAARPRGARRSK